MMSLMIGVQRLIWYVCSVILSLRGTVYNFLRLLCRYKVIVLQAIKINRLKALYKTVTKSFLIYEAQFTKFFSLHLQQH